MKKLLKLFPLILMVPYLVGNLVLWAVNQVYIYQYFTQYRLWVAWVIRFLIFRHTQFETLAIVGVFLVLYNLLNREES